VERAILDAASTVILLYLRPIVARRLIRPFPLARRFSHIVIY
jgi:hypothetical protein